jgi:hypothetical protein
MKQYAVRLEGLTPLIMHNDNLSFAEKIAAWQKDPANKMLSVSGDDRSPAWTWMGYLYHDGKELGIPSDNLMTALREGGAKISTGKRQETFKKHTQSGLFIDQQQFSLYTDGVIVKVSDLDDLIGNVNFAEHIERAESLGFELFVKRAKIGTKKHVRVRPMFRRWVAEGSITVIDEEVSGITKKALEMILNQAGAVCGLGDWRPSSPASGTFGKFKPVVKPM